MCVASEGKEVGKERKRMENWGKVTESVIIRQRICVENNHILMSDLKDNPEVGDIINKNYVITRRIGAGSFGAIYEVQSLENGKLYAVKLEKPNSPSPQLQYEYKLYQLLDAAVGIPKAYEFWTEDRFRGMVMDRLGSSLGYFSRKHGKILSLKTVLMCAIQMLCRLEYLHERSLIHRDIKPDNFVFGVGKNSNLLYMIDLGLAKKYRDLRTLQHINYAEDRGLAGTARYVSINVHLGVEQSRRDDLESVGYVLISLVKGKLPWQGMEGGKDEKYDLISRAKMDTPLETLCDGLASEFLNYMQRVRALRFDERPVYTYLRGLFVNLMIKNNYAFDYRYDWVESRSKKLNDVLKGAEDQDKVVIPMSAREVAGAARRISKKNGFLQPLPFFSVMNEAASFVGRSKGKKGQEEELPQEKDKFPDEQTLFRLDQKHTKIPLYPVQIEFEKQT